MMVPNMEGTELGPRVLSSAGRACALGLLWVYSHCISPWTPPVCRFHPTCSAYAREAIMLHGLVKGLFLSVRRLLRCHPLYKGPLNDPVPPPRTNDWNTVHEV